MDQQLISRHDADKGCLHLILLDDDQTRSTSSSHGTSSASIEKINYANHTHNSTLFKWTTLKYILRLLIAFLWFKFSLNSIEVCNRNSCIDAI